MKIIKVLFVLSLLLLPVGTLQAQLLDKKKSDAPKVAYFPAAQVSKAFEKGMPLLEIANYKVHASHREGPGMVEVHTRDTDVIYMLEGTATLVTGGTVIDGKNIEPEEIRGKSIEGGETRQIIKGDVIIVPNGRTALVQGR
jgi:hypothetical protein